MSVFCEFFLRQEMEKSIVCRQSIAAALPWQQDLVAQEQVLKFIPFFLVDPSPC